MKIALVMITKDRGDIGRKNYFSSTMESLHSSGLFKSSTPFEFHIVDGGSDSLEFMYPWDNHYIHPTSVVLNPNVNAGRALLIGGAVPYADWVTFIEDDIEVCRDFLDGVAWWLHNFGLGSDRKVFTFYTPYREVEYCHANGDRVWDYPADKFYGTQCFAIRPEDARSLGDYLVGLPYSTSSYDMEIKAWASKIGADKFLASVPCFCQHIGKESSLFQDPARFHQCGAYPGKDWSILDTV